MDGKKTLATIVLASYLAIPAFSQQKPEFKFNLSKYENTYLKRLQDYMKATGKDYLLLKVPGDNLIIPNISKYPTPIIEPDKKFRDDKFVIKPKLNWPQESRLIRDYGKKSQGILLFEYKHK